jgi:hypothetical protein
MRRQIGFFIVLVLAAGAASAQFPTEIIITPQQIVTAADRLTVTVFGPAVCDGQSRQEPARIEGRRVILPVSLVQNCEPRLGGSYSEHFTLGPLPAGFWTFEAVVDGALAARRTLDVEPLAPVLHLHDGFFEISVDWSTPDGALQGKGYGVWMTEESGYFWFFSGSNPEIYVKVLDGTPVNGHWWVFISSTTNLEFKVTVRQLLGDVVLPVPVQKTYVSPAGANRNFIDTDSF